jgi:hypothetical protein
MRKIHFLSYGAALVATAALSSGSLEGCSSSSPGPGESVDSGTGEDASADSSSQDSAAADTSTSYDSSIPADVETPDANGGGADAADAAGNTGEDAGDSGSNTGSDSGQGVDASDAAPAADSGSDSGEDAAVDAGEDASSAADATSTDAAGDATSTDAAGDSGPSFANPVQISGIPFNANTVVTTATGGVALTAMDGAGDNNDFATASEATALGAMGLGLADDAFYAGNGSTIPAVQLSWTNTSNVLNTIFMANPFTTATSFSVPAGQYEQLQIYATGGNGGSTLNYTLTYATGAPTTASVPIPDWCVPGTLATGTFTLGSASRVNAGTTLTDGTGGFECNVYAINLNPDSGRALTQVSFTDSGGTGTYLVFFGATAW